MPQTRWLINSFISYSSKGWEGQDPGASRLCPRRARVPGSQRACLVSSLVGGEGALWGVSYKGTDPILGAPLS